MRGHSHRRRVFSPGRGRLLAAGYLVPWTSVRECIWTPSAPNLDLVHGAVVCAPQRPLRAEAAVIHNKTCTGRYRVAVRPHNPALGRRDAVLRRPDPSRRA